MCVCLLFVGSIRRAQWMTWTMAVIKVVKQYGEMDFDRNEWQTEILTLTAPMACLANANIGHIPYEKSMQRLIESWTTHIESKDEID